MPRQSGAGFTLIELLVVIAIIGILSAIGLVSLNGAREKARDAQRKSDLAQIRTALALFYDDNGNTFPGANPFFDDQATPTGDSAIPTPLYIALVPSYLSAMPASLISDNEYIYNYITPLTSASQSYALLAHLESPGDSTVFMLNSDGVGGVFTRSSPGVTEYNGYSCAGLTSGKMMVCGASAPYPVP